MSYVPYVPDGIAEEILDGEDNCPYALNVLFLGRENFAVVVRNIYNLRRRYGLSGEYSNGQQFGPDISAVAKDVRAAMKQWASRELSENSGRCNAVEALEYYNKRFTASYCRKNNIGGDGYANTDVRRGGDPKPDVNPFRIKQFGRSIDQYTVDDYRSMDVWSPNPIFTDGYSNRTDRGIKGLNNPHIIGAHKRHVERDIGETLRARELSLNSTWGYDMSDIYDTTGGDYGTDPDYRGAIEY